MSSRSFHLSHRFLSLFALVALQSASALEPVPGIPTTFNGTGARTTGNVETYRIPVVDYPEEIHFSVRGADGGKAQAGPNSNQDKFKALGGGGATATATFTVHPTEANALRPGGEIRVIVGNKGADKQGGGGGTRVAAGGGGGSGVLYRGPEPATDWEPLLIGGGGGGAIVNSFSTGVVKLAGENGRTGNAGGDGSWINEGGNGNGSAPGFGGSSGNAGGTCQTGGEGGAGWNGSSSRGATAGQSLGGSGGVTNYSDRCSNGGFGCGGGGGGGGESYPAIKYVGGGGGGGYSGGGGAGQKGRGGGGGSFISSRALNDVSRSVTTGNGNGRNGQIQLTSSTDLVTEPTVLPVITITGQNPIQLARSIGGNYSDPGATAADFYGQPLGVTVVSNNVDPVMLGTYSVVYETTDGYDQTVQATRTVNVVEAFPVPLFIAGESFASSVDFPEGDISQSVARVNSPAGIPISYALSGVDSGLFTIGHASGDLRFMAEPNFEAPADFDANNVYEITVTASSSGYFPSSSDLTIVVTDSNDLPSTPELDNDSAVEGSSYVGVVSSTDEDASDTVTYLISSTLGVDGSFFNINPNNGVLSFKVNPDYETPQDSNGDNVYMVGVVAEGADSSDRTATEFSVRVVNLDESPEIPTLDNLNVAENNTFVGNANAVEPDGQSVTYSLGTAGDSGLFTIVGSTGALSFQNGPDFEGPTDLGANNSYLVEVIASDGINSRSAQFQVEVTDADEAPIAPELTTHRVAENVRLVDTPTSTDPEGEAVTFSIVASPDAAYFEIDPASKALRFITAPDFENPTDDNDDNVYEVAVRAEAGGQFNDSTFFITVDPVNEVPGTPVLDNRIVVEGTAFVGTVSADDPEDDELTFSLGSVADGSSFSIDPDTGELSFLSPPDYEEPFGPRPQSSYAVEVVASDGELSTSATFFIEVHLESFSTIAEFRSAYGLAADGSDDFGDLSNNDVPNIYYHLFGMGDPNGPARQARFSPSNPAIPGMPSVYRNGEGLMTFLYTVRVTEEEYATVPQLSSDLLNWESINPFLFDPEKEFSQHGLNLSTVGGDHYVISLKYRDDPGDDPVPRSFFSDLFFRVEVEPLSSE